MLSTAISPHRVEGNVVTLLATAYDQERDGAYCGACLADVTVNARGVTVRIHDTRGRIDTRRVQELAEQL